MRTISTLAPALILVVAIGCNERASTSSTATQPAATAPPAASPTATPEQLAEIGAKIQKNPADANAILASYGIDATTFEKAIRKVAEDPAAARRYRDAFKRATT